MRKLTLFFTIAFLICSGIIQAENGVECAISIYQTDSNLSEEVLLYADTAQFIKGVSTSGFLIAFSVDIEVTEIDSTRTGFTVHIVTLGPSANTYSRNFTVEYGLPARIVDIKGKLETNYTLVISPLEKIDIDTSFCPYNHLTDGTFEFTPSANMDIYYMPNSRGDFFWNVVRGLLEEQYRQFQTLYDFSLPGKYTVYLCPCFLPSVIWDKRFGIATDPTRSSAHAIYTQTLNAADPFVVIHTAVLRNYGYAPLFLSEGLANYLSFAIFDMKEIQQQDRTPHITELVHTYNYLTADAYLADRASASFVTFLIDKYGFPRFRKLYKDADDLNLATIIEETYDASLAQLENDWKEYIDTVTIPPNRLYKSFNIAEAMFDFSSMYRYSEALVESAVSVEDSMRALPVLKRACFFTGNYYRATDIQNELLRIDGPSAINYMALATYKMMNGSYDEAYEDLATSWSLDSTEHLIVFNFALNHIIRQKEARASELLLRLVNDPSTGGAGTESRIMLANMLRNSTDEEKQQQAQKYYKEAVTTLDVALRNQPSSAATHMWLGIALLGQGQIDVAENYLQGALFLESRPFYLGMIHLWLGKLADAAGKREDAISHYSDVLTLPSADYHQKEANQYLKEPYSL